MTLQLMPSLWLVPRVGKQTTCPWSKLYKEVNSHPGAGYRRGVLGPPSPAITVGGLQVVGGD
jgi:hypothetical protein